MVEADFSGNYVNADNTKENDLIEIVGEGIYNEKEREGKKVKSLDIPVLINGKEKIYTPSMSSGKEMVAAWGKETKFWIGKKGIAKIVQYKSYGVIKKAVEFSPIIEIPK